MPHSVLTELDEGYFHPKAHKAKERTDDEQHIRLVAQDPWDR